MEEVLLRAVSFMAVIVLGYVLRRVGFFKEEDFDLISKMLMNITLPAVIIVNFSTTTIQISMLLLCVAGFLGGMVYIVLGALIGRDHEDKSFMALNLAGYNIGTFTMPFASSFLGAESVVITSMFDMGNSFICLGGSYSAAEMLKDRSSGFSLVKLVKNLVKSIPLDVYVIMTVMSLLHIGVPTVIVSIADVISGASSFLAMLMIGVGIKFSFDGKKAERTIKILFVRYAVAITIAAVVMLCLPLPRIYRVTIAVLVFSPLSGMVPVYAAELKEDYGLASSINAISIIISVVFITALLSVAA